MHDSKYQNVADIFHDQPYASWFTTLYSLLYSIAARLAYTSRLPICPEDIVMETLTSKLGPSFYVSEYHGLRSYLVRALVRQFYKAADQARERQIAEGRNIDDFEWRTGDSGHRLPIFTFNGDFFNAVRALPNTQLGDGWRTVFMLETVAGFSRDEAYHFILEKGWPNAVPDSRDDDSIWQLLEPIVRRISRIKAELETSPEEGLKLCRELNSMLRFSRHLNSCSILPHLSEVGFVGDSVLQGNYQTTWMLDDVALLEDLHRNAKYYYASGNLRSWMHRGNGYLRKSLVDSTSFFEIDAFEAACVHDGIEKYIHHVFPHEGSRDHFLRTYTKVRPIALSSRLDVASRRLEQEIFGTLDEWPWPRDRSCSERTA